MRTTQNAWLSCCRAHEHMKCWRDFAKQCHHKAMPAIQMYNAYWFTENHPLHLEIMHQFFGAPQNCMLRSVNKHILIVCTYLSSILPFKKIQMYQQFMYMFQSFSIYQTCFFTLADIIIHPCWAIQSPRTSINLSLSKLQLLARKTHHGISIGADPKIRKIIHPYPNT